MATNEEPASAAAAPPAQDAAEAAPAPSPSASAAPLPPPRGAFRAGEEVLGEHLAMLYDAKILQVRESASGVREYRVHYKGWHKRHDEWITEDLVHEKNDENEAKRQALIAATQGNVVAGAKRKINELFTVDDKEAPKTKLKITIPRELKRILARDWTRVCTEKKIAKLPRSPTVAQILERYVKERTTDKTGTNRQRLAKEIAAGLGDYFDQALPVMLLYRYERPQYEEWARSQKFGAEEQPRDRYGGEHLLRLFVKLPELLEHTSMEGDGVTVLQTMMGDLANLLKSCIDEMFPDEYEDLPESVINKYFRYDFLE